MSGWVTSGMVRHVPEAQLNVRAVAADVRDRAGALMGAGHRMDLGEVEVMAVEVLSNAVKHTASGDGGGVSVRVLMLGCALRVEIQDAGGADGRPEIPAGARESLAEGGRGLLVVEGLSDRWGFRREGAGRTTVWFEVDG